MYYKGVNALAAKQRHHIHHSRGWWLFVIGVESVICLSSFSLYFGLEYIQPCAAPTSQRTGGVHFNPEYRDASPWQQGLDIPRD